MQIVTSWMEEGIQQGLQQGLQQGIQQGLQQGIQQGQQDGELKTVLRQLDRRFGSLPADRRTQIQALSLLQIEDLADALLDFTTLADLVVWLHQLSQQVEQLAQQTSHQLGEVSADLMLQVRQLSLAQMATLTIALPTFTQPADLTEWLDAQRDKTSDQ